MLSATGRQAKDEVTDRLPFPVTLGRARRFPNGFEKKRTGDHQRLAALSRKTRDNSLSISIKATVIFATYNGERTLPAMLDALCQSTTTQTEWKIVAVDNNSTDNTNDILRSYLTRLPMEIYFEKILVKLQRLTMDLVS